MTFSPSLGNVVLDFRIMIVNDGQSLTNDNHCLMVAFKVPSANSINII